MPSGNAAAAAVTAPHQLSDGTSHFPNGDGPTGRAVPAPVRA
ncbi:hypothetical protein [Streptomyces sp. NPDC059003]